jgi:4-hydroxy-2-oxoheptanedioate aldolase
MEITRRNVLGAGIAIGLGAASQSIVGQKDGNHERTPSPAATGRGASPGHLQTPVNSNVQPSTVDWNYKPRRLNKAIELWEDGQPIYYSGSGLGPGVDPYAQGVRMARTYMDAINVEMEHGALDFMQLREFMRGLVDGGPTRSGHRTPAVFVETCIIALDKDYMRANTWVLQQLLDCGVHGIHMCHARDWEAVEVATQMAMRYPFPRPGIPELKYRGLRGSSASYAAQIWGMNTYKYNHLADLWPLNKQGEMIFGVKIEDTFCDQDYEKTIALPGISMAEWGPGDHSYWLYGLDVLPEDGSQPDNVAMRPEMVKIRQGVLDACKKNNVMFLNAAATDPNNPAAYVIKQIQDGAMVLEGGEAAAIMGREFTKRKMPV